MSLTRKEKLEKLNKLAKAAKENPKWIERADLNEKHADSLEDFMRIAVKILDTLKEKKITQKKLAAMLEVSPQALTRIIKGRQNLTINTIRKIEKALNISLINIIGVNDSASQFITQMIPVEIHYNNEVSLFKGEITKLKVEKETKKTIVNLSEAS